MSYDRYTLEYYLTRNGWTSAENVSPPLDRVETWMKEVYQGSGFGRESEDWRRTWNSPEISSQELEMLHAKYPRPKRSSISEEVLRAISKPRTQDYK